MDTSAEARSTEPALLVAPNLPGESGPNSLWSVARALGWTLGLLLVALAAWEGYKFLGQSLDDTVPGLGIDFPIATNDLAMPHTWEIFSALAEPARRGDPQTLLQYLLVETWVTLRESFFGLIFGAALGLGLAVLFSLAVPLRRGLMPWMVVSQTIPLVAIAPMIVVWGGQLGLPAWMAVTGIAGYLAFFPVAINALRGLQSPPMVQREFMLSVAASRWQGLTLLRFPSASPYIFSGLRLAATASVVGAIVGELSAGTGRGIGRSILSFTYYYSNGPEKLYAAVLIASIAGVIFVQAINLIERVALRHRVLEGRRNA